MNDKILSGPPIPPKEDIALSCIRATLDVPQRLEKIGETLEYIALCLQTLALVERRRAEKEQLLTPEDIRELDYDGSGQED